MFNNKKMAAVVVSAGSGLRMGLDINKPYIEISGKKIIEITLDKISKLECIDKIVLVIRKDDQEHVEKIIKNYDKEIVFVYGKQTREMSTLEGLLQLSDEYELVLTHDGVRPFASLDLFEKVIKELKNYKAVISATRAKDTVKILNEDMTVKNTPNRSFVYNVQTPQAYDRNMLESLYKKYRDYQNIEDDKNLEFKITDDSQLFELFTNEKVKVVEGEFSNIKITTKEDLIFAKGFMEGR